MAAPSQGTRYQLSATKHFLQYRHHTLLLRTPGARHGTARQHFVASELCQRLPVEPQLLAALGSDQTNPLQLLLGHERRNRATLRSAQQGPLPHRVRSLERFRTHQPPPLRSTAVVPTADRHLVEHPRQQDSRLRLDYIGCQIRRHLQLATRHGTPRRKQHGQHHRQQPQCIGQRKVELRNPLQPFEMAQGGQPHVQRTESSRTDGRQAEKTGIL